MNLRLIHELEIAIHEAIRPTHPHLNTNVFTKGDEERYFYCELAVIFKLRTDEEIDNVMQLVRQLNR